MHDGGQPKEEITRQMGVQPIDEVLDRLGVANHQLVEVSTEHLTHKMVQKARKGRRLTRNVQGKVLNAVNHLLKQRGGEPVNMVELFNYKG